MKNKLKTFLKKNKFLPLGIWDVFRLNHGKANKNEEEIIKNAVDNKSGLYIYKKGDRILYVGKAKPLYSRIKSHFHESYKNVSGDTKYKTWHKFFSDKRNIGQIKVLYKEVKEEKERQILEQMLDYVLCPEFKDFRENLEKNKK